MSHTYDVGTKAWQPDTTEGWVASEVEQKIVDGENVTLVFALENGEVCWRIRVTQRPNLHHKLTMYTIFRAKRSRRHLPRSTTAMLPFLRS
jgi:hypothetical protein